MKRVLIPGVILCGADVAQAVDDKNMYMHVFEEMTVYAPVPVPVNGNTHYTSESIERLPTGNGNISDLLRTNPAVRMDSTQSTSLNQGDIRPEKISIHGASPYQNAYLIDGISATNNLNPANESDASSATNISGMSQGYYLDVSLLDNVTLYDSFVPVEFGRFNGGVIDAKIKRFNADDSSVKLGYRTTRSDWLTSHIDENNKSAFNQGSSGSTYYSPDFKKNFYTLSFNQELADNFGVTAGLSRRQSDITRADYVSNDGIVAGRAQYKNVIDTALSKFTWFASDRFTHDLTLKYTGSSRDYNTSTFPQSDREMGNKSYGLAWDMDTQLAWAKLRTTVGWDHISDYTRHDHDIWYTELSCTYGDITGRCTRGGLGHISQAVDNYTFKTRLDWQKFAVGNVSHQPYFGAEYIYSDAWTERHNQSESYVINAAGKKTNHTIYHKGKGSLGIDNYTLYMADRISWRNVSLMPGVRYDYDNYLSNHNISPRFMTEWDIFADQTSMITVGYNRYYGGNILDMGLRDIRNSWTESVSGNKTLTRYQDLKTPYNDELAMGLQQKIGKNVIARANYVYREAHDQISKSSRTDSATKTTITEYNNDGKTKTHSFNLSFELAEPLHIRQVDINPQIVFANALMAELATIDQHGFSAEELDDVKSTRLTWLKNAVDQQAERDLRMLTSRLASSSLNNTPFLSPEETYQLSKRLWQQITVQSLAEKWQQLRKNQDAFWEQMVNNELAAKKALSPAAILALEKEYANKKLAAYIFPGRNLSLTVDADPQAEISSKETLAENLTSLTLSNGAKVILAKSAGEEQKLQIIAVSNKGDLSFPAQQKTLIALANKAVSGSGVGELSSSSLKRWSAENSVTMSSKVSGMNTLLSVSARTNNPEPGFHLINQRITHSTINDNIWASLQNAQIQALKTLDQRPAEKFAQQMYETRYVDDRTKLLQENQIAQFTAADALAADRQLFSSPADITFVIVGNVAEDKLVALITRYLGSIKHSDSPLAAGKPLTRATDNASVTVKEQNEPVAQVSQWRRYDSRTPVNLATRMALDAFNVALAKDLRVNIREQASGAYSVSSRLSVDPQAKDISHLLAFTCQPERHDELLTLANEVMVKRLAKGISEQELNEYQQNVQRSLDIQQRSVQQLANTIVNSLIQYDDPAAWTEQEQLLKQMTVENVNTAVKQYLSHPVNTYTGVLLPK